MSAWIAFDFETSGILPEHALQPWRIPLGETWVTSLATVRPTAAGPVIGGGLCVGPESRSPQERIKALLDEAIKDKLTLVAWNAPFDIAVMLGYGFESLVMQCKFLDGMLLWKHLTVTPEYDTDRTKKKSYGLKSAVMEYIPQWAGYETDIDFHDPSLESLAKLHEYNIKDTAATLHLTRKFYKELERDPQRLRAATIEAQCLPLVAWANWYGLRLDDKALAHLGEELEAEAAVALEVLAPYGVTKKIVRSPKQLAELMYREWGLPVIKQNKSPLTGKVTDSTDKEVLHELAFIDSRAKYLRNYREALGNKTKFVDAPVESVNYNSDGRSHPLANVFGTYTGRMSYSSKQGRNKDERQIGFALHQEKREARFRDIALPPDGHTLVEFDAAGQEYRWMAVASGDAAMQRLCMPGEDPHSYMGAQIAREEYEVLKALAAAGDKAVKPKRQLGKVANLSCIAEGTLLISSHGIVPIEHLPASALVWDGSAWVQHGGVVFQGLREVITYAGLTATPDHLVFVKGAWVRFDQAAEYGWRIESATGAGRSRAAWTKVRVVGGLVGYGFSEIWCAIRALPLWLRAREGFKSPTGRDGAHPYVRHVQQQTYSPEVRAPSSGHSGKTRPAETYIRNVPEMQQPQRPLIRKLWWAGNTLLVSVSKVCCRVGAGKPSSWGLQNSGLRSHRQQWALCAGESKASLSPAELAQHSPQCICTVARTKNSACGVERKSLLTVLCRTIHSCWTVWRGDYSAGVDGSSRKTQGMADTKATARVYDILDCGPDNRFAANGLIVHNCGYRTSAAKLRIVARVQYNLPMELPEATHIRQTYLRTYPGVQRYWQSQISKVRQLGYAETFAGRRVQVQGSWAGQSQWSLESTAINYPIQGTGADQKYLALAVLRPYIVRHDIHFAWELHDGLYFYVPTKYVQQAIADMKYLLDNLPYAKAWGLKLPIPMPWDCKVGPSWGQLKEVTV